MKSSLQCATEIIINLIDITSKTTETALDLQVRSAVRYRRGALAITSLCHFLLLNDALLYTEWHRSVADSGKIERSNACPCTTLLHQLLSVLLHFEQ